MRKIMIVLCATLFMVAQSLAQSKTITGKVSDESSGQPLKGVTIKGGQVSSMTDDRGVFTISVPSTLKELVFSYVGFESKRVSISKSTTVDVVLKSSDNALEEVVVTGYSTQKKSTLSGSVAKVAGKELENKPVLSFDQALAGKAAGVMINTSSGLVGDAVTIRVRGASSISSGSQPLIIMDGVPLTQGNSGQLYNPVNSLADINPNDIESVEVLKDASATAIYGSRASGGVLLITTKKGKSGQTKVTYDGYIGMSTPTRKLEVLNGEQYNTVINRMRTNAGLTAIAASSDNDGDGKNDNTDWQEAIFRNGITHNHQVSVSGGAGRTTFYGSANYNDFENYMIVNRQSRGSVRLNINSKVNNWLDLGINTQFAKTTSYGLGSGTGGALSGVPFGPLTAYPNVSIYNATGGYYIGAGANTPLNNTPNPVAVQNLNYDTRDTRRFIGSFYGEISFAKNLKFKSQYNIDYLTGHTDQYWDPSVGDGAGLVGVSQVAYNETNVWSWFNTLNYNTTIKDHSINVLLGAEYTRQKGIGDYAFGIGINDPLFRIISSANFSTVGASNGIGADNGLASYFGGVNYGFRGKYLATFNLRTDGYSGFGAANRWGTFPSGSVAWKVSQESFWRSKLINDLKLRTSYGVTGNSNIGNYPALATFNTTQYADIPSLNLGNPGNSSLRWEQSKQFDVGVDLQLLNKINITIDYYKKRTKDLILSNPILATVGIPNNSINQNIGTLDVNGVELSIGMPVLAKKDFNWDINFNWAWNQNKVVSTNSNGDDIVPTTGNSIARPGYNLGAFYLIQWGGVNPENGQPIFLTKSGERIQYNHLASAANRWTKVSDKSVTTPISGADRVLDNSKTPYAKFYGGLSQTLRYKNFDMVVDIQYALGHYLYNSTMATLMQNTSNRNKSTNILSAWSNPGDITNTPRLIWGENQAQQASTRWLEKGDFARLRNIQLGFSLPRSILEKMKISKLRIYGQIQNVFVLTGYSGIDPEANASGNTNINLGIDSFRPYLPRTFTFGVSMGL